MHADYQPILEALVDLDKALEQSTTERRSLADLWGWQYVQADKTDLRYMVEELVGIVKTAPDDDPDLDIEMLVSRIKWIQANIVPQLWNGNGQAAGPSLILSLVSIKTWLRNAIPAVEVVDPNALPTKLARQSRTAKSRLDNIAGDLDGLTDKIKLISDAHAAAEALPTDLEDLKQLRAAMLAATNQVAADRESIGKNIFEADALLAGLRTSSESAAKLIAQCEDAYQITTTKGLSASFARRAFYFSVSMWVWVAGLVVALGGVAFIGHERIAALTALANSKPEWGVVILNLVLSALSVGAPLWFAWVATKQIGQRFRLQEDYGFKASIAKAYEGYRREAHRIDEKFEKQLFEIALTRLDEAPLRTIESDSHGSPYHELFAALKDPKNFDRVSEFARSLRKSKADGDGPAPAPADKQTPA